MIENIKAVSGGLLFLLCASMFPITLLLIPTVVAWGSYFYSKGYRVTPDE